MGYRHDLSHLAPSEHPSHDARLSVEHVPAARGRILRPPASFSDSLTVALIDYGKAHPYTVPAGQWVTRVNRLPPHNALCLVQFDNRGDAWITGWVSTAVPDPAPDTPISVGAEAPDLEGRVAHLEALVADLTTRLAGR